MDDHELLQNYANSRCQESFAVLVSRYVNLVYSAALRQLRDHHQAEEAAQAVFIVLARKARGIGPNVLLGGWLLQTTSYAVRNLLRADQRRKRHERKAAQMNTVIENDPASAQAWDEIAPLLDEGIRKLPAKLRDAVILRYLEDRSCEEVATRLGISEEAARQRLSRAVELLRQYFQRPRRRRSRRAGRIAFGHAICSRGSGLSDRVGGFLRCHRHSAFKRNSHHDHNQ